MDFFRSSLTQVMPREVSGFAVEGLRNPRVFVQR